MKVRAVFPVRTRRTHEAVLDVPEDATGLQIEHILKEYRDNHPEMAFDEDECYWEEETPYFLPL